MRQFGLSPLQFVLGSLCLPSRLQILVAFSMAVAKQLKEAAVGSTAPFQSPSSPASWDISSSPGRIACSSSSSASLCRSKALYLCLQLFELGQALQTALTIRSSGKAREYPGKAQVEFLPAAGAAQTSGIRRHLQPSEGAQAKLQFPAACPSYCAVGLPAHYRPWCGTYRGCRGPQPLQPQG